MVFRRVRRTNGKRSSSPLRRLASAACTACSSTKSSNCSRSSAAVAGTTAAVVRGDSNETPRMLVVRPARPKIHVVDSGLAARLMRVTPAKLATLDSTALTEFGNLLETFVVGELRKQISWLDEPSASGHWRTQDYEMRHNRDRSKVEREVHLLVRVAVTRALVSRTGQARRSAGPRARMR